MSFDANRTDLTIGVLGSGAMGRGIVQVAAAGGINVLMNFIPQPLTVMPPP